MIIYHISPYFVTYRHKMPQIAKWQNVTKCGALFFFFIDKMWRHNFYFVCTTMRYIAQQSATLLCDAWWRQVAPHGDWQQKFINECVP